MKTWLFPLWVIIDILIIIAVISLWITAPEYFSLNISVSIFGIALSFLLLVFRREQFFKFVKTNYFKNLSFHFINAILVFCLLSIINYLGNKNYIEFDLTSSKRNSLTEQSLNVLRMVDSPLKLTLFSKRENWAGGLSLLKLYQAQNKNILIDAIDVDLKPELVKSKGIEQNGTVVIDFKNKESMFVMTDELSVTNALLKSVRKEEITLYLTTGHNELSCTDQSEEGIFSLCRKLEKQNYLVKTIDLTATKRIPSDATAVLILGPIKKFLPSEVNQLREYLEFGGSLFLGLAPSFDLNIYENLIELAKSYGLQLGNDIVIDRLSTVQGTEATIPIVNKYNTEHPITMGFNQRTIFPLSSSVRIIPGNDSATILASTSDFPGSWAEADIKGVLKGKAFFKEGKDLKGPVGLIGVGESVGELPSSRLVLLGSSSFLVNAYQQQSANATLFLNSISWAVNDEGIISFNRPGLEEDSVILSSLHLQMIFVISIFLVPIIFFSCAIFIYRRQRLL
jgi:ABC-type uncharacterized transport system involved in gliding motility auxiliary subunit